MYAANEFFNNVVSNLRTFRLRDLIDILVISFVFYEIFQFARKSRAGQLVRGVVLLIVSFALAYLLELRLRHASLLLRGTSKTVAEIAGECGFEDPSYFARVFKRKYGAPPNQCRNAKAL